MTPTRLRTTRTDVVGTLHPRFEEILTPGALEFLTDLHDRFSHARADLLAARQVRRGRISDGRDPAFRAATAHIREDASWTVAPPAPGLVDRRVEITGPTDRKMTINALNSGASVWLADQEDATSPTWTNVVGGQLSLYDALRERIDFTDPVTGKDYRLGPVRPTVVMRPRGWHLPEKHLLHTDREGRTLPTCGALVDFGLYLYHNARRLIETGSGPYFYLPKLEAASEARLWNEIFCHASDALGLPRGTIRATVLIETITAAFEMEEILYELREHCAGLNAGRWDYLFSIIKTFRSRGEMPVLPDRSQLTMTVPFMRAYTEMLVATCHRRGAHAIGGMSAFIPNRRDPEVTARALEQVRADKQREADAGYDGSWVAHPDLVPVVREVFDATLGPRPNQLEHRRPDVVPQGSALLDFASAPGAVTEKGVRTNVTVALRYLDSWLGGHGAAAVDNLMEDVATAEICRTQLWQWIHRGVRTAEGRLVTAAWVRELTAEVLAGPHRYPGDRFADAAAVLEQVALGAGCPSFLTNGAYCTYLVEPIALERARAAGVGPSGGRVTS